MEDEIETGCVRLVKCTYCWQQLIPIWQETFRLEVDTLMALSSSMESENV